MLPSMGLGENPVCPATFSYLMLAYRVVLETDKNSRLL